MAKKANTPTKLARRPVFAVLSDLHLAPRAWIGRKEIFGDSYRSLQYVTAQCVALGLPLVLTGDVFDVKNPDSHSMSILFAELDLMRAHALRVYFIQGQHEMATPPYMSLHPWAEHVDRKTFCIGSLKLHGLDYRGVTELEEALKELPSVDVLLFHQVWTDFMGSRGQLGMDKIQSASPLIITGDFHKPVEKSVDLPNKADVKVVSPGAACMQDVSECPDKYYVIVYDDLTVSFEQIPTRQVFDISIQNEEDIQKFLESGLDHVCRSAATVGEPIVRILHREVAGMREALETAAKGRCNLFWKLEEEEETEAAADSVEDGSGSSNIFDAFSEALSQKVKRDSQEYKDVMRLLTSHQPKVDAEAILALAMDREEAKCTASA